jgi:hypothetical protein
MTKTIMAFGLILSIGLRPAIGQCLCPEGKRGPVFSHEFGGGQKLIICGYANGDHDSVEVESYSDIVVIDCRDDRILLSIEPGETDLSLNMFRFQVKEDCVFIQQITRMPGEPGWHWAPYAFLEKKVSLVNGRLTISDWQNIFVVPPKTREEIAAFLDAYENHFDMAGDPMEIPDKLMLCALNGSRKAERFLLEFPKDHSKHFDGALAERYFELLDFYRKIQKK